MEEKVANALNLVQKDGDSFAKRAEMYYKHRPELIAFIEESVRAYRALAERYDKLSTDLQKANTTIASVFPDQLPYDTDYEDDDNNGLKIPKNVGPEPPKAPKVPESKDLKGLLTNGPRKTQSKKATKAEQLNHVVQKSGLTKEEAVKEIDKLQKDILSLQTVKEFTKSSYENGLAKFWEIENKVSDMQQKVCTLQDEFKVVKGIEDDDARAIMTEAALKSCQETLVKLQEKHDKSSQDARLEHERIQNLKQKLMSLKDDYLVNKADEKEELALEKDSRNSNESEQEELQAKIKESLEELSKRPLTVSEMADTVDKLVNKVISLEMLVSSQTVLIDRLRLETDDLQTQIRNLEDDKANLIDGTYNLGKTLNDMDQKLNGVQDLEQNIENQNNSLKRQFTEARCNLQHLSENLHHVKPDEEGNLNEPSLNREDIKLIVSSPICKNSICGGSTISDQGQLLRTSSKERVEEKENPCTKDDAAMNIRDVTKETIEVEKGKNDSVCTNGDRTNNLNTSKESEKDSRISMDDDEPGKPAIMSPEGEHDQMVITKIKDDVLKPKSQDETNWQELLLSGLDDKEKVLLQEYTTILRKFKAAKKELAEEEQKNQGTVLEMKLQVRDLKTLLAIRENEIHQMKQKLKLLQEVTGKDEVLEDKDKVVNEENEIKSIFIVKSEAFSEIEEKLRMNIDAILDENLDFWLRFSTTFHQVQKFKTEVEDLQQEIMKMKAKGSEGKSSTFSSNKGLRSDISPIYKHLKEIQNELTIWLEQSALLKNELQRRCSSLSNIQEEITRALREGVEEEEITFSTHQAAKFQGEVLNMQQENNKVNEELQAGLDHVSGLQLETEKTIRRLDDEFGLFYQDHDQRQPRLPNRAHVPLRSFIFGVKSKKQKPSILSCINPHKKSTASNSGVL